MNASIAREIAEERARQDAQWGGPTHDDTHDASDWMEYVGDQIEKFARSMMIRGAAYVSTPDARQRIVKVAALAVAALESMDRKTASKPGESQAVQNPPTEPAASSGLDAASIEEFAITFERAAELRRSDMSERFFGWFPDGGMVIEADAHSSETFAGILVKTGNTSGTFWQVEKAAKAVLNQVRYYWVPDARSFSQLLRTLITTAAEHADVRV